jgi:hypothetical protein
VKSAANPMSKAHAASRCMATSKRTGERCKGPAVKGSAVCRFHGAGGGGPSGEAHPNYRHGIRSRDFVEQRKEMNKLMRLLRNVDVMG